jgi:uncharacterized protein (DUF934 family)
MPPPSEGHECATASPPPSRGRDKVGEIAEHGRSGVSSPLTLPHKVEENLGATAATGEPDPDGSIWQGTSFLKDAWVRAAESEPLPDAPVILSKARWLAERDTLVGRNGPLGLQLEPGEALDDIALDVPRFAIIALSFPKFADGRAFSTARLLREKHGFAGELRAVGNVLSDQILYMRRVGFDSFEVTHAPTRRALAEARIAEVTLHYQPTGASEAPAGTRPWLRRS